MVYFNKCATMTLTPRSIYCVVLSYPFLVPFNKRATLTFYPAFNLLVHLSIILVLPRFYRLPGFLLILI